MKNDTSNLVDLDHILNPKEEQIIEESIQAPQPIVVDWDEILQEWSYRLPKGYPTMVDGKFTEREEVIVLNELLEEKGLQALPLPEAKPVKDFDKALQIVTAALNKTKSKGSVVVLPFIDSKNGVIRLEVVKEESRAIVAGELAKALKGQLTAKSTELKFGYDGNVYTCVVKKVAAAAASDTDVKEGLSVIMSYYPDYLTQYNENSIDTTNYKGVAKKLISFMKTKSSVAGLSDSVIEKCRSFLEKGLTITDKKDIKTFIAMLNQNSSHANTFDIFFQKNEDWYVERSDLFDKIRLVASQISGLEKDKWCPGDVYFIRNGYESVIEETLNDAAKQGLPQGLIAINDLFSNKFAAPEKDKCIVAVSLKMEKAQAGKLKSGLEQYAKTPTEYTLDDKEVKLPVNELVKKAEVLQKKLVKFTSSHDKNIDIDWQLCDLVKMKSTAKDEYVRRLRSKYAAYKALDFIYEKIADKDFYKLDDALVSLVVFGLGVISKSPNADLQKMKKINPPFFKVIASGDGNAVAKPILFEGGKPIALWDVTGQNAAPKIKITDVPTFSGISIQLGVSIGDDKFDCNVAFRPNTPGSPQITIELQKAEHK